MTNAKKETMDTAMAKQTGRSTAKNYRRRRRTVWCMLLFSVSTNAFAPPTSRARRESALSAETAASRTWDQTRHKLVYYGEDREEDPSPPIIMTEKIKTKPMPVVGYNAKEICEKYDRRPFQVGWRMNSVGLPLLGKSTFILKTEGEECVQNSVQYLLSTRYRVVLSALVRSSLWCQ